MGYSGPMSKTLGRRWIYVIQMFCVCWVVCKEIVAGGMGGGGLTAIVLFSSNWHLNHLSNLPNLLQCP